jgi:lincosamide nucleotidyltransferase A/C/D/E
MRSRAAGCGTGARSARLQFASRLRLSAARWGLSKGPLRYLAAVLRKQALGAGDGTLRRKLLWPLYDSLRGEVTASELLATLDALRSAGVACWLAGGWGVDALVHRQTRRHRDLDIVLDDFALQAEAALSVLEGLGFRRVRLVRYEIWMPERWVLSDVNLRLVDLLGIDWGKLAQGLGVSTEVDLRRLAFAEGVVAGRRVPCLSVPVQLLFHSGYRPRPVEAHDVGLLKELVGR